MNNIDTIDNLKEKHNSLLLKIIQKGSGVEESSNSGDAHTQIIEVVNEIKRFSRVARSFDDYCWLSDAAIKWQTVLSSTFETPTQIELYPPQKEWILPMSQNLTEKEIIDWLKRYATFAAYASRAEKGGDSGSNDDNWHAAEVFFASEVLDGRVNFAGRISSKSYTFLENIWLKDVKCLRAYFRWMEQENKKTFLYQDSDYFEACNHLRERLVDPGMKAQLSEFNEAKDYIQNRYLGDDGKLHISAGQDSLLQALIRKKAYRIFERRTLKRLGSNDNDDNWFNAETYIKMFYENIIPAIELQDEVNKKERILRVLKAFQYSKMNRFIIIDCFEAALAIYFLDPDIIQDLWDESANDAYPNNVSVVHVDSWPQKITLEGKLRIDADKHLIGFNGVMSYKEKDLLLNALGMEGDVNDPQYANAVEELFRKSREVLDQDIPESTTESVIEVKSWPQEFSITEPCHKRFWINKERNKVGFNGVMLEIEKEALINALKRVELDKRKKEHIEAIEKLFKQSQSVDQPKTQDMVAENVLEVNEWPQEFQVEGIFAGFWVNNERDKIGFRGVMSNKDKEKLLGILQKIETGEQYIEAIERLYKQSRLILERTTL